MVRGEVYSASELIAAGVASKRHIGKWKKRGLRPLAWGMNGDCFLSDDIIDLGRQPAKKKGAP